MRSTFLWSSGNSPSRSYYAKGRCRGLRYLQEGPDKWAPTRATPNPATQNVSRCRLCATSSRRNKDSKVFSGGPDGYFRRELETYSSVIITLHWQQDVIDVTRTIVTALLFNHSTKGGNNTRRCTTFTLKNYYTLVVSVKFSNNYLRELDSFILQNYKTIYSTRHDCNNKSLLQLYEIVKTIITDTLIETTYLHRTLRIFVLKYMDGSKNENFI